MWVQECMHACIQVRSPTPRLVASPSRRTRSCSTTTGARGCLCSSRRSTATGMYMYVHVRMRMHMFWGERVPLLEQTLNRDGSLPDDDRTRQAEPASPGPDPALMLLTTPGSHSALCCSPPLAPMWTSPRRTRGPTACFALILTPTLIPSLTLALTLTLTLAWQDTRADGLLRD